jgi:hypothetical protein
VFPIFLRDARPHKTLAFRYDMDMVLMRIGPPLRPFWRGYCCVAQGLAAADSRMGNNMWA